ncbi:hypothetical protein SLA2020_460860 [Shorea laevis]
MPAQCLIINHSVQFSAYGFISCRRCYQEEKFAPPIDSDQQTPKTRIKWKEERARDKGMEQLQVVCEP